MGLPNLCSPLAGLWVHSTTAVTRLARAYRLLTVLRGLTVINNDVIVGVGGGTVKGCVGACARVDRSTEISHVVASASCPR